MSPAKFRHLRRGLGMVELLVALAISAALLTAVAVATHASFQSHAINMETSDVMQRARVALHRMLTDIRNSEAHAVDPDPNSADNARLKKGENVEHVSSIALYDVDKTLYWYRKAGDQVLVDVEPAGGPRLTHVLLRGVEAFDVTLEPLKSADARRFNTDHDQLKRATILLTVKSFGQMNEAGDNGASATVTFSSSVVPRRNVW